MQQQNIQQPSATEERKSDFTLIINDIHENTSEEQLWKHLQNYVNHSKITKIKFPKKLKNKTFRSRGFAFVTLQDENGYNSVLEHADLTYLTSQPIRVLPLVEKNKLNEFKKFNLFVKGFKHDADPKKIKNEIVKQLGNKIFSFKPAFDDKSSNLRGYGYCSFLTEDDMKKMIQLSPIKVEDQEIIFFQFQKPEPHKNNLYLKDFYHKDIPQEVVQDQEKRKLLENDIKQYLESLIADNLKRKVAINSIFVKIDDEKKKPFAFICFKEDSDAQELFDIFSQNKSAYSNFQEPIHHKQGSSSNKVVLIQNIDPKTNQEQLKQVIQKEFGIVTNMTPFKEPRKIENEQAQGQKREFKEARYCTVFFQKAESADKIIANQDKSKEFKELFVDKQPKVVISLTKDELSKFQALKIKKVNIVGQNQQVANTDQQQNRFQQNLFNNTFMRPPFIPPFHMMNPQFRQFPQQYQPHQYNRQGRPQQNNRQPYRQFNNYQNRPNQQQPNQQMRPAIQNQPIQGQEINQQPPQQQKFTTFEQIKNELARFLQLPQQEKRNILGQLLFPQVSNICQNKQNAPKITGMLIDFSVFEENDVIEFLEKPDELRERVQEAEQLIEQSSTVTNNVSQSTNN